MKQIVIHTISLSFLLLALLLPAVETSAQVLAFPGADGYAKNITGGRGGKVYHVTRLDDCSDNDLIPGTFRWALHSGDNSPRIIVFDVAGTINITSTLKSRFDNVSILGQTAPGGGICITGYGLEINGNRNYIIRHLRFRAGEIPCYAEAPEGQHVDVNNGSLGIENSAEVIIDHCSITWSNEECMTMFDDETTTVQNCIIGEGLYHSWHHKYENNGTSGRGFAMQWGGERVNMHHTLITNSNSRAPRFNGVREEQAWLPGKIGVKKHAHDCFSVSDFSNNVLFNWAGSGSIYGGEFYAFRFASAPDSLDYFSRTYLRNNFYRPGPATQQGAKNSRYFVNASGDTSEQSLGEWYLNGNKFEIDGTYSTKTGVWSKAELERVNADNYYGISNGNSSRAFNTDNGVNANIYNKYILKSLPAADDKYALSSYQPISADDAYTQTLANCGATLPRLDEVDQRLVDEAAGRIAPQFTGSRVGRAPGIIDSPNDIKLKGDHDLFWHDGKLTDVVNGQKFTCYPYLGLQNGEKYAVDSDGDGMPDAYEDAAGLNKLDPADGVKVAANGYTNFENYANGIADGTLRTADYQTSAEFVEPGLAVRKENITITFQNSYEGNTPAPMTIKNGGNVVFRNLHGIYREGSTVIGWTDGSTTYKFDTDYEGRFTEDITLRPAVASNLKNLSDRTEEITITWDFTTAYAPQLSAGNAGVYTTNANVDDNIIDTRLSYSGLTLTIPAVEGSIATINYCSGAVQTVAAIDSTIDVLLQAADIKSVTVTYPFIIDISDKPFHSVKVGNCVVGTKDYTTYPSEGEERVWSASINVADAKGFNAAKATNYELAYANLSTIHSVDWMETEGQERDAYRNCINPHGNDEVQFTGNLAVETSVTHALNGFIVGSNKTAGTYKMYAYIKDCALVRTYACGSGSGGDMLQCIAIPLDGSERLMSNNIHKLYKSKQLSEYFDLELDPNMSYRLEWSSVGGVDMMVGAIKFYDSTMQAVNSGDAIVKWDWEGAPVEDGVTDPAKAFASAKATVGAAIKGGRGEHGNDPDGNTLYVAQFTETATTAVHSADHMIEFTVTPKNGWLFTPAQVDFKRVFSTNKQGQVDIFFKYGDEAEDSVRTTKATSSSTDISIKSSTAAFAGKFKTTAKPFSVRLYFNNIPVPEGNINYWVKVFNAAIYGTYAKSSAQRFNFSTEVSPVNAGVITQSPKGNKFVNWTDAAGSELSTSPQFVFSMPAADQTVTANFKELQTVSGPYHIVSNAEELEDALAAAASASRASISAAGGSVAGSSRYYIFLKNGIYDFGKKAMTAIPQNTSLIGESMEGVVIRNNPDVPQGGNSYQETTPTLFIDQNQNDVYLQDLTICQARDWTEKISRGQALAMRQRGKRAVYKNVTMQGVQDTYYLNKADATAYFENCTMQGNVDYIYGDGTMWFEQCQIKHIGNNGGYITAPNTKAGAFGIVFNDCSVESANGDASFYLGRPWDDSPHATYLNTTFRSLPVAAGWAGMTSGLLLRFHEYGSKDAQGNPLDLSKRSIAACNAKAGSDSPVLTAEQAAAYTLENVFGTDWQPQQLAAQLAAPTLYIDRTAGLLSWNPVRGAYAYAICKNGAVVGFTTEGSYPVTDLAATYTLRVANLSGGLGAAGTAAIDGIAEGIEGAVVSAECGAEFNLQGQKVGRDYKGVVIQNGRKTIRK